MNAQEQVDVVWHSFQLDPDFPMNFSMPVAQYLADKKGIPMDQIISMQDQLAHNGKAYGIDFKFDKPLSFNTLDVHRLIHWSKTVGKPNDLKEAFIVALYTGGVDLSKSENILKVVDNIGLDTAKAKEVLENNEFKIEVEQDIDQFKKMGVRGVPFFLINKERKISGAQDDTIFENTLSTALKNTTKENNSANEDFCLPDGDCN
jgi:predicted DsbA family dithiol-disulfide isomerase